jgi:hypothetical protein
MIGIEYMVTPEVFASLPEEEKKLWHSYFYEVASGLLVATDLPTDQDLSTVGSTMNVYGKTFLLWDPMMNPVPMGIPQLMMSFIKDGQLDSALL